jgi:hypothetical protein
MSGTVFMVEFTSGSRASEMAAESWAAARDKQVDVPEGFTCDDIYFKWSPIEDTWYCEYRSIQVVVPNDLRRHLELEEPQFRVMRVRVEKSASVVDRKAAVQGEYDGDPRWLFRRRQFQGCSGIVDNYVGNGGRELQSIVVYGPLETFGDYMIEIRSRRVRPKRRFEPGWWRMLLGL